MNPDRRRVELNHATAEPAHVKARSERVLAWQKTLPAAPLNTSAGRNDWPWPQGSRP